MTDNFVAGKRQNFLVAGGGTRIAAANPADPLANLSLAFLGDPTYADGRTATDVGLPRRRERLLPAGRAADARCRLRRPRLRARAHVAAARRGCSTGCSPTTTRRTCSASASTRATGSSSRSAWTPTARPTSQPTRSTTAASAAPGARCSRRRPALPSCMWRSPRTPPTSRPGVNPRGLLPTTTTAAAATRWRRRSRSSRRARRSWPGGASGARRPRARWRRVGRASGALPTASTPTPTHARWAPRRRPRRRERRDMGAEVPAPASPRPATAARASIRYRFATLGRTATAARRRCS